MTDDKATDLREAAERANEPKPTAQDERDGGTTSAALWVAWFDRFRALADPPTILALLAERERLRGALEFYAEQVRDCRKVTSEGNDARRSLDRDGGEIARRALTEGAT